MDRIDNVDLREALREIAERNTYYHLDNDINISFDQMEQALKLTDPAEKTLIWVSYPSGIDCYSEREVFQKDTRGYNGVLYHGFDMQSDHKLTYAVKLTGVQDGAPQGNIYEIDIRDYAETVRGNAVVSDAIRLALADPLEYGREIAMPKDEFNRRYPLDLPKMLSWKHDPADPAALQAMLHNIWKDREANSEPRSLWAHTSGLHDRRLAFYAGQILRDLNKLDRPNAADGQSFSVPLNSIIAANFDPGQLSRLLDALPYKDVSFAIRKGERDLRVVVPRDEVLLERHKQRGGLTVNRDGKEIPVSVPPNDNREKPSILEALRHGAEKSKQQSGHNAEPKKSNGMEI